MDKGRIVNTNFWRDNYVIELDPVEKLIFLYLLTNPATNLSGIYEISFKQVAFDTGIDKDMVDKIISRFVADGKMYYERGWLVLINFMRHQRMNPSIKKGITRTIKQLPDWLQQRLVISETKETMRVSISGFGQSGYSLGTVSPQLNYNLTVTKPNLTKPNTLANKSPENTETIKKLFYEAIKSLGLPVQNHNTIKVKIEGMMTEASFEDLSDYLTFMRDQYKHLDVEYKPHVNNGLDLYAKRVQIMNIMKMTVKDQATPRVWRAKA